MTSKTPACFPARTAVIALRTRSERNVEPVEYMVVFPDEWSKSQLLAYCRAVHTKETVRLVSWNESRRLWLTNPRAFSNYKKGILK